MKIDKGKYEKVKYYIPKNMKYRNMEMTNTDNLWMAMDCNMKKEKMAPLMALMALMAFIVPATSSILKIFPEIMIPTDLCVSADFCGRS